MKPDNTLFPLPCMPVPRHAPGRNKISDGNSHSHGEEIPFTSQIEEVGNSTEKCVTINRYNLVPDLIIRMFKGFRAWGSSQSAGKERDDELTEVLSCGRELLNQEVTLLPPEDVHPVPQEWQGGCVKRMLVSVGLFTSMLGGGAGYKYYAGRNSSSGQGGNFTQPYPATASLQPFMPDIGSGGVLEDSFGNHALHHDGVADISRRSRYHLDEYAPPVGKNTTIPDGGTLCFPQQRARREIEIILRELKNYEGKQVDKEKHLAAIAGYLFNGKKEITGQTEEVKSLARMILNEKQWYGGMENETLSVAQAESVVRQWFFSIIPGMPPEEYIADKLKADTHPDSYTISSIRHLLSLTEMDKSGYLRLANITPSCAEAFNVMWHRFLETEMPFLKFSDGDAINQMKLNSKDFVNLYAGTRFLNAISVKDFTPEEAIKTGEQMWESAISEGVTEDMLAYFSTPALFVLASAASEKEKKEKIERIAAINEYIEYREKVDAVRRDVEQKYNRYISATKNWHGKRELARGIISHCQKLPWGGCGA